MKGKETARSVDKDSVSFCLFNPNFLLLYEPFRRLIFYCKIALSKIFTFSIEIEIVIVIYTSVIIDGESIFFLMSEMCSFKFSLFSFFFFLFVLCNSLHSLHKKFYR